MEDDFLRNALLNIRGDLFKSKGVSLSAVELAKHLDKYNELVAESDKFLDEMDERIEGISEEAGDGPCIPD